MSRVLNETHLNTIILLIIKLCMDNKLVLCLLSTEKDMTSSELRRLSGRDAINPLPIQCFTSS